MSAELLPCRYCGSKPTVTASSVVLVCCRACRIEICGSNAIAIWNSAAETAMTTHTVTEHEAFKKDDSEKLRLDLLPPEAIEALGRALTYGARKYGPDNWRKCKDPWRYTAALLRHIFSHMAGEKTDRESGLSHLDHAIACIAMLIGVSK